MSDTNGHADPIRLAFTDDEGEISLTLPPSPQLHLVFVLPDQQEHDDKLGIVPVLAMNPSAACARAREWARTWAKNAKVETATTLAVAWKDIMTGWLHSVLK